MGEITSSEENYLKSLYHLQLREEEVGIKSLSLSLGVKMPTANSMIKKLADKGLVLYQSYKPIRLTKKGIKAASLIIRKHRLTEMYLVEKMGFSWDEVHEVAEQIEHVKSPKFFDKMDELLNFPSFDPHGSPIPKKDGTIASLEGFILSMGKKGKMYKIISLLQSDKAFLNYLDSKGIKLYSKIEVLEVISYEELIKVKVNDFELTISDKVSSKLFVQEI